MAIVEKLMNKEKFFLTPVMKQFSKVKLKHPDSIILFRMGDFYETFDEDAKITSNILNIALTKRANGAAASVPLAGFPYHSLDKHVYKLLNSGYKVAICEQVEDPKLSKGIVKREVVEILSPGTAITENFLRKNENNYLCSIYIEKNMFGYAILDHSTGEFYTGESNISNIVDIIKRFKVREVIISENQKTILDNYNRKNYIITTYPNWIASETNCYEKLINHFEIKSLKGFGIENSKLSIIASGSSIYYIENNFFGKVKHITSLAKISDKGIMRMDTFTINNLEIFNSISGQNSKGTLINTIDNTITSMGSRLLKHYLIRPLINKNRINNRLNLVEELVKNPILNKNVRNELKGIHDIQRLISRLSTNKSNPRDLINLSHSLLSLSKIKKIVPRSTKRIRELLAIKNTSKISNKINKSIKADAPVNIINGGFINSGISKTLDKLRKISNDANNWIINYQEDQKKKTNISSLKIGYNRIFGYYIDITKTHLNKIPDNFIRKQTLTNSERYFTKELKEYEETILNAKEKIIEIEFNILEKIIKFIIDDIINIQHNAKIIAKLDVLTSHALVAIDYNYCKPSMSNSSSKIHLIDSRHPVIEKLIPIGDRFIPNDLKIDCKKKQIAIITGPNMAGKSTFLRQIGIISVLSQIGSFVPAKKANLSIIDQLFTRVGASDNLSEGESTFLVEMNETANILNNATPKSLIILDEIGRGTSTFDGLSLAWGIIEYIHNNKKVKAKTLFATHYHELISLAEKLSSAFNLNVSVEEYGEKIIFLRKIIKGGASKSYGINVAKMAGLPLEVLLRAKELLDNFMKDKINNKSTIRKSKISNQEIKIFNKESEIINQLRSIDLNKLTPIEAINKLNEIKNKL